MKLPSDSTIAAEKIKKYLLEWRPENDKSAFLAAPDTSLKNGRHWLRTCGNRFSRLTRIFVELTAYGEMYEIRYGLTGPNGVLLKVVTIWMTEHATGQTKFITLFPDKEV